MHPLIAAQLEVVITLLGVIVGLVSGALGFTWKIAAKMTRATDALEDNTRAIENLEGKMSTVWEITTNARKAARESANALVELAAEERRKHD